MYTNTSLHQVYEIVTTCRRGQAAASRAAALVQVSYQDDGDRRPIVLLEDAIQQGSMYSEQGR